MKVNGRASQALLIAPLVYLAAICSYAQQPLLTITSPTDGTVVKPGDVVAISVSADSSVQGVGVVGSKPLPYIPQTGANQFQLSVPTELSLRRYFITANGMAAGALVESDQVNLDVERQDAPVKLSFPTSLLFQKLGDQLPITINGTFNDGLILNMTESTHVSYTSRDTTVATVNATGMVTAVGSGNTFIIIKAGTGPGGIGSGPEVAVEVRVPDTNIKIVRPPVVLVVPRTSQSRNLTGIQFLGVVRSAGIRGLSFAGDAELDQNSGVPAKVILLLNEKRSGADFHNGTSKDCS